MLNKLFNTFFCKLCDFGTGTGFLVTINDVALRVRKNLVATVEQKMPVNIDDVSIYSTALPCLYLPKITKIKGINANIL